MSSIVCVYHIQWLYTYTTPLKMDKIQIQHVLCTFRSSMVAAFCLSTRMNRWVASSGIIGENTPVILFVDPPLPPPFVCIWFGIQRGGDRELAR
jgi:hypothetical protein